MAFPTDTVAGLGCRADSPGAVAAIFALKGRDPGKPLVLFVQDLAAVERMTGALSGRIRALLESCWPGALTAVLPLAVGLPDGVGRAGTVGIRIPAHPVPLSLARLLDVPLATTSANRSGEPPLRVAGDAVRIWGNRVLALDGESGSQPSTVADLTVWPPKILRPGALSESSFLKLVDTASQRAF